MPMNLIVFVDLSDSDEKNFRKTAPPNPTHFVYIAFIWIAF